jgi:Arc/MetJ-type ribon-helix-helix transcriptional regulator
MRKTTSGGQAGAVLHERVQPLASPTVSTTVRLPVELAEYLASLVESGQARDKTDAITRCIRRHQETQAGVSDLGRVEAGQADLASRLDDVASQLQGLRDDLVLASSQTRGGLVNAQQTLAGLFAARLYDAPEEQGQAGGGGSLPPVAPTLPVTLMSTRAAAPAPVQRAAPAPAPSAASTPAPRRAKP